MLRRGLVILLFLVVLVCGYGVIRLNPSAIPLPIEIPAPPGEGETSSAEVTEEAEPTAVPTPAPPPTPTPIPGPFLSSLSTGPDVEIDEATGQAYLLDEAGNRISETRRLPRHGLIIAFFLPLLVFGLPWVVLEVIVVRYVQPRGVDLSVIPIKAQDGLFIDAAVSMTAKRTLSLASTRMSWPRVRDFVEKSIEQELNHAALSFPTLEELERNLKFVTEGFLDLPVVQELSRDFGLDVLRFNVEVRYRAETMDALKRKADASAGGTAFLAYAAAAHLDPDRPESHDLYKTYQQTSSQVDAARNLGGGVANLLDLLTRRSNLDRKEENGAEEQP